MKKVIMLLLSFISLMTIMASDVDSQGSVDSIGYLDRQDIMNTRIDNKYMRIFHRIRRVRSNAQRVFTDSLSLPLRYLSNLSAPEVTRAVQQHDQAAFAVRRCGYLLNYLNQAFDEYHESLISQGELNAEFDAISAELNDLHDL